MAGRSSGKKYEKCSTAYFVSYFVFAACVGRQSNVQRRTQVKLPDHLYMHATFIHEYKMLSYRRETALQGAL